MSIKQSYIDRINANDAAAAGLNPDDFINDAVKKNAPKRKAEVDTYSAGMDSQIANTQSYYDKQIGDKKIEYESQYERNAVQKLINEKQIAERNANLGLTDSGLNRTQQTAAQLSYANQKGKIDLARQSALDNLSLAMTDAITTLQNQKASGVMDIENYWHNASVQQGTDAYNAKLGYYNDRITADTQALTKLQEQENELAYKQWEANLDASTALSKAQIAAAANAKAKENESKKTLWYYTGTYDEDDNPIFRNSEGKTQAFGKGVNPYKGMMHNDIRDKDGNYDPSKAFSNGYQPNNIGGKKLYSQEEYEVYVNGNKQKVWSYDDGITLWAWDGSINEYIDVTSRRDELGK